MKRLFTLCLPLLLAVPLAAQHPARPELTLDMLRQKDLSMLWTGPLPEIDREDTTTLVWFERVEPLGYIGPDFHRFRIHFSSISRSGDDPLTYRLAGATCTGDNVCRFRGELHIDSLSRRISSGEPDEWGGIYCGWYLKGHYILLEEPDQSGSGIFEGTHTLGIAVDAEGNVYYDTLMLVADGYSNNTWEGTRQSYATCIPEVCNWGDYRIPNSDRLDVGCGDFCPADEYLANGWQSYRDAWDSQNTAARDEETRRWWLAE